MTVGLIAADGEYMPRGTAFFDFFGSKHYGLGLYNLLGHDGSYIDGAIVGVGIVSGIGIGDVALSGLEEIGSGTLGVDDKTCGYGSGGGESCIGDGGLVEL